MFIFLLKVLVHDAAIYFFCSVVFSLDCVFAFAILTSVEATHQVSNQGEHIPPPFIFHFMGYCTHSAVTIETMLVNFSGVTIETMPVNFS